MNDEMARMANEAAEMLRLEARLKQLQREVEWLADTIYKDRMKLRTKQDEIAKIKLQLSGQLPLPFADFR